MKRLTFCAIMVIASLSCVAQIEIQRPECAIAESDWERIHTKPDYLNFAKADTLDMMELYVYWFNWSDGWIAEVLWTDCVYIEEQHPEKFQRLLKSIAPQWYDDYVAYRDGFINTAPR